MTANSVAAATIERIQPGTGPSMGTGPIPSPLAPRLRWRGPTQPLCVGNPREREVPGKVVEPFDCLVQRAELVAQRAMTGRRQDLDEILEHCAQTSRDLQIVRSAGANLGACDVNEVLPVRRAV